MLLLPSCYLEKKAALNIETLSGNEGQEIENELELMLLLELLN